MCGLANAAGRQGLRYLFWGGCTALVSFFLFCLFQYFGMDSNAANLGSILLAILFAYGVNRQFVFCSNVRGVQAAGEFASFVAARALGMGLEIGGVFVLTDLLRFNPLLAKALAQGVVLAANYLSSKHLVFSPEARGSLWEKWKKRQGKGILVAACLFPICVMAAGIAFVGAFPFGDRSILVIDGVHQYLPFFAELYRKVHAGGDLLFSWNGGLGYNFFALFAYYLTSPLNFLVLLLPEKMLCESVTLVILLKVGLCGGAFAWYLGRRGNPSDWRNLIFSSAYALCAFVIGYNSNLMWLDCVYLLPLVAYGLERLALGGSGFGYTAVLFLSIVSNFYIGFIICIFCCLYFLCVYAGGPQPSVRGFVSPFRRFLLHSLLAGGMAAALLLPALLCILRSQAGGEPFPSDFSVYGNWFDLFARQFALSRPIRTSGFKGDVNIYAGLLPLLLAFLYVLNPKIPLRRRVGKGLLAAFLLVSMNVNILNYLWHGMHLPHGFPNRFTFIFNFLLLQMGFDALHRLRGLPNLRMRIAVLCGPVWVLACWLLQGERAGAWYVYMASSLLFAVYGVVLYRWRRRWLSTCRAGRILCFICGLELALTGTLGIVQNGTAGRSRYLRAQEAGAAFAALHQGEGFYRMDMLEAPVRNMPALMGMKGISFFSSTFSADVGWGLEGLGLLGGPNKIQYDGANDITDDILGVKYRLSWDYQVSRNPDALPLGYWASQDILSWDTASNDPLTVQEQFLSAAVGRGGTGTNGRADWKAAVQELGQAPLQTENFTDSTLQGTICAPKDGVLFLSIPYDGGWSVRLDGMPVSVLPIGALFCGITLPAGVHTVSLWYTPPGLFAGIAISMLSLTGLCSLWVFQRSKSGSGERRFGKGLHTRVTR